MGDEAPTSPKEPSLGRLLVLKPSSLGDIVHALQVVQAIHRQCPRTVIHWVVRDVFAPLLQIAEGVEELFPYHRRDGWRGLAMVMAAIQRQPYDVVLDMQGLARTGLMAWRARAERKIGRADAREWAWLSYTEKVALPPGGKRAHAVDILRAFLPVLGLEDRLERPLSLRTPELSTISDRLRPGGYLVLIPHTRGPGKEWPDFRELARRLRNLPDGPVIVWDGHRAEAGLSALEGPRFINTTGKTRLPQLAALIRDARLVVSNDSGPMHLAAALGVPVLGLFGPTPPERFAPYPREDPQNAILQAPRGDLNRLEVETVWAKVGAMMSPQGVPLA